MSEERKVLARGPTDAMLEAGYGPFIGAHDPMFIKNEPCGPIWKAMFDAAPDAPAQGVEEAVVNMARLIVSDFEEFNRHTHGRDAESDYVTVARALLAVVGQNAGEQPSGAPVQSPARDTDASAAYPAPVFHDAQMTEFLEVMTNPSKPTETLLAGKKMLESLRKSLPNVATAPATTTEDSIDAESSGPGPLRHQSGQGETPMVFTYKLNAMEFAALSAEPAKDGYGDKRKAVLDHVAALEHERVTLAAKLERAERGLAGALAENAQLRRLIDRGTPISEYERRQSERAETAERQLADALRRVAELSGREGDVHE